MGEGELEKAEEALLQRSLASHLENLEKFQAQAAQDAHSLGNIAEPQLDYRKAQQYFEQAAHLRPQNSTYLNDAGRINHTLGAHEAAITYFDRALASDLRTYGENHPDVARDRNNLGVAYQVLGEYKKAIGYYEQALNVTPSSPSMGFIIDVSSEFEATGSKQMKISLVRQVGSIESTVAEITGSISAALQGVFIDRPATSAEVTYSLQTEVLQSHGSASASGRVDHIAAWGII